jgi:hypothetical protein
MGFYLRWEAVFLLLVVDDFIITLQRYSAESGCPFCLSTFTKFKYSYFIFEKS